MRGRPHAYKCIEAAAMIKAIGEEKTEINDRAPANNIEPAKPQNECPGHKHNKAWVSKLHTRFSKSTGLIPRRNSLRQE